MIGINYQLMSIFTKKPAWYTLSKTGRIVLLHYGIAKHRKQPKINRLFSVSLVRLVSVTVSISVSVTVRVSLV